MLCLKNGRLSDVILNFGVWRVYFCLFSGGQQRELSNLLRSWSPSGKKWWRDIPGGPGVKNPPADAGYIGPLVREESHGMGGQSACATPSKSARCGYCSPRAWNPCSCNKSSPHASTKPNPPLTTARESPCTATKTQHSQKKIFFNLEKEKRMSGRGRLYRPLGHCKDFGFCSE